MTPGQHVEVRLSGAVKSNGQIFSESILDESEMRVRLDDSIIQDTFVLQPSAPFLAASSAVLRFVRM